MQVGFIGLGIMGSRMASLLQKNGCSLTVHNRTPDKATASLAHGSSWADTPRKVGECSEIVITMLSTPEAVKEVALGTTGFIQGMKEDGLWVNVSTVNPSFAREMKQAAQRQQIHYLDAPVAGSTVPAERGELLFLVGGDEKDVATAAPLLDIMGKKTLHMGDVGQGSALKILINQLLAQSMVAFAEALVMGEAMGLERERLFDVLLATPVVAPVMEAVRPKLECGTYEANFPLKWLHKDLHLSGVSAYEQGVAATHLNSVKEIFAQAKQAGYGDQDFTAIYDFLDPGQQ